MDQSKKNDIIYNDDQCVPRTKLELSDYDWMEYKLKAVLNTKKYGELHITFAYFGLINSKMKVVQIKDETTISYTYVFSTDLFEKHIKRFMEKHISNWTEKYAFSGEECVVDFFNDVISNSITLCE